MVNCLLSSNRHKFVSAVTNDDPFTPASVSGNKLPNRERIKKFIGQYKKWPILRQFIYAFMHSR